MNRSRTSLSLAAFLLFAATGPAAFAQGILVSATGPVNRSMGGAGTAAPLEAQGALFWNPASISALESDEVSLGFAGVLPVLRTSSSITGLGAGTSAAEPGISPLINFGWVHHPENSDLTFGVGLFSAAGFRTNFPASTTNPVFTPQSNAPGVPGGLGQVYTEAAFLQFVPTVAWQMNDRWSFGFGPTVTIGDVIVDPFVFDAPDDADGSGAPRYASGIGSRTHWGGGFQAGAYYEDECGRHLGFTFKSPQWMERFSFNSEDESGLPRSVGAKMDLPMVLSLGTAWSGWDRWVLATDVRYFDYANTDGFNTRGFRADGSVAGLGWNSIFSVATGAQYKVSEDLFLRVGYTFNECPIPDDQAFFNIGTPLHYQHEIHVGGSWRLAKRVWLSCAYTYYLESEVSGPIVTPLGAVPGSNVTNRKTVHIADVGITVRY
ncbi:MAG: outer membrane protein transport protein [Fuerstiella sp.]